MGGPGRSAAAAGGFRGSGAEEVEEAVRGPVVEERERAGSAAGAWRRGVCFRHVWLVGSSSVQ